MLKTPLLFLFGLVFVCFYSKAQVGIREAMIHEQYSNYGDSLRGFDETAISTKLHNHGVNGAEYAGYLSRLKREFIRANYYPPEASPANALHTLKPGGNNHTIHTAPCVNEGFEQTPAGFYPNMGNAVAGWTVSSKTFGTCSSPGAYFQGSSEFWVHNTPIPNVLPVGSALYQAPLNASPLGGTAIVQLNNTFPSGLETKLSQTFPVTAANSLFVYAFAGMWENSIHLCCEQPAFRVIVSDCLGNVLTCTSSDMSAYPAGCGDGSASYSVASGFSYSWSWTDWQVKTIDLSAFIGTCVTIDVINKDCIYGAHAGSLYFDAQCSAGLTNPGLTNIGTSTWMSFCPGASQAQITAPLGYASYQWFAPGNPPVPTATTQVLTIPNPVVGAVYTVQLVTASGCTFVAQDTLQYSTVSIIGQGTSPSCPLGASGTASIQAMGSGAGYTYSWSTSPSIITTSSVIPNLAPGVYSVVVTAIPATGCGSSATTVTVGSQSLVYPVTQRFCGNTAYLAAPQAGANYKWYNATTLISGSTGSGYTVNPATNGSMYHLGYTTAQGCRDSVQYTLSGVSPGYLIVWSNQLICQDSTNGTVVLRMNPATGSPLTANAYSVYLPGSATPYTVAPPPASTNFTINNLPAGTSYTALSTDGICSYSTTFVVNTQSVSNFALSPLTSSLCAGDSLSAAISFSNATQPGQYTFLWAPNLYLQGNNANTQATVIKPVIAPGSVSTLVYTVVVTPTAINCPETKTLSITGINLATPTISPIPQLCYSSPAYTIVANPPGGQFNGSNPSILSNGVIIPTFANTGANTFTYVLSLGMCSVTSSSFFTLNASPSVTIVGPGPVCQGQSVTLTALGADNYSWAQGPAGALYSFTPNSTGSYTVTGTSTLTTCWEEAVVTVTVNNNPALAVSGNTLLCDGESASLTVSGAGSYSWSTNSINPGITVSPLSTTVYSVTGVGSNSCSSSINVTVQVMACTGMSETVQNNNSPKIYPNPAGPALFIEAPASGQVMIYNTLGSIVMETPVAQGIQSVPLEYLSDGIYLLRYTTSATVKTIKLVKKD